MKNLMKRLWVEEDGQGAVEYALIIALVSLILVMALSVLETPMETLVTKISNKLTGTTP